MAKILSAQPPFTNCSGLTVPRSLLLVSTDPGCRVSIVASPDGQTLGATVLRVLTTQNAEVTWDGNDFLTFVVTAGKDPSPVVAVSALAATPQGVVVGGPGGGH